jgi:hypothetical protein
MGHGSLGVWRGDLLTVNDAESLLNGLQLPLFVNMTCLNGFFQAPYADSMAEGLLKAQGGRSHCHLGLVGYDRTG